MEKIENLLINATKILKKNTNGHLPLSMRVTIMKAILNEDIINKIFFACAIKVYSYWENVFPNDDTLIKLLTSCENTLYKKNLEELEMKVDYYKGYFDGLKNIRASFSAHSALSLAYSIAFKASMVIDIDEYRDEDDNYYDWEEWNADFWASMAYSNGNPFLNEGDIELRKEFWLWYLDIIKKTIANPNNPLDELPDFRYNTNAIKKLSLIRSQTFRKDLILEKIQSVIIYSLEDLKKQYPKGEWDKFKVRGVCMKAGVSLSGECFEKRTEEKKVVKLNYALNSGDRSSANLMNKVKSMMYEQAPKEGAWLQFELDISEDLNFNLIFNYDDILPLPENKKSPDYLLLEFKAYPRSKEFTPEWLQKIVDNKVTYLSQVSN